MMVPFAIHAQVHDTNFPYEILIGISSAIFAVSYFLSRPYAVILLRHEVVIMFGWHPSEEVSRACPRVLRFVGVELGSELRRLREDHSIKLEEVASVLEVAPSTLSRIETGKAPTRRPT